ncbi:MAG: hypothetical protein COC01_04270 [Bacteroidetes bacterium]|nr:MAG: hypothetical protein COC01_04270 [Bacteroidota bacterium]
MIASTVYAQKNYNSAKNEDMQIVHNDKTGIVLNVVEQNKNQRLMTIQDQKTGDIYKSISTRINAAQGTRVIFRPLCHCTCRVEAVCNN